MSVCIDKYFLVSINETPNRTENSNINIFKWKKKIDFSDGSFLEHFHFVFIWNLININQVKNQVSKLVLYLKA
jgi:hypothetical protein